MTTNVMVPATSPPDRHTRPRQVILVSPWMFANQSVWCYIFESHRKCLPGRDRPPLFQAFLVRCSDPRYGCCLVAGFDHVLGDGASYGMFMQAWSDSYEAETLRRPPRPEAAYEVPPHAYPYEGECFARVDFTKTAHRFVIPAEVLAVQKACIGRGGVSSNDILMAQALVALGPARRAAGDGETNKFARVALLVDQRGRGLPTRWFGNGVIDLNVAVSWDFVLRGDVARLAGEIRACIVTDLEMLQHDMEGFNAARSARANYTRIFCWNSWANAGRSMLNSSFGDLNSVESVEWMNMHHVAESSVVLVMPQPNGALMMQVACCTPKLNAKL